MNRYKSGWSSTKSKLKKVREREHEVRKREEDHRSRTFTNDCVSFASIRKTSGCSKCWRITMTNPDELRKKVSNVSPTPLPPPPPPPQRQHQPLQQMFSLPSQPNQEPERTYMFTGNPMPATNGSNPFGVAANRLNDPIAMGRGHSRSVSHGGGSVATPTPVGSAGRPLKSAMKGHQRALSQGQISDELAQTTPRSGHSRMGSKTDFILPPGHKDEPINRDVVTSATSHRGHSRQASRSESIYTLRRAEMPSWWKRYIFSRRSSKFDDRGYRIVVPNHTVPPKTPKSEHPNGKRVGNKIRTTKYTLLSFLPKNLLEQFHRVANLYFIFIVVLNWFIDAFGKEVSLIPVLFVLGVTAIKDLFEDRRRRASDKRINKSTCRVYNGWVSIFDDSIFGYLRTPSAHTLHELRWNWKRIILSDRETDMRLAMTLKCRRQIKIDTQSRQ